jgi:adenylate cyclase
VTALCLVIAALFAGLRLLTPRPLEVLELKALDLRFAVRGAREALPDVVIVAIDEGSLERFGRWPWPRSRVAELVDRLSALGVRTMAFDAVFDLPDAANDATFVQAMRASGRVVLGEFFDFDRTTGPAVPSFPELTVKDRGGGTNGLREAKGYRGPIPALAAVAAGVGHVNFIPDIDQAARRVPLAIRIGDRIAPALSVAALAHFLGGRSPVLSVGGPDDVRLAVGDRELPIDASGDLRIDFLGPSEAIPRVSAAEVLERRAPREALEGKLVLIGGTAVGLDSRPTPFSSAAPGVEIHASVIDNLLRGRGLVRPPWLVPVEAVVTLLFGLVTGLLIEWRAFAGAVAALGLYLVYLGATQVAFATSGLVASVVYPYATVITATLAGLVQQYLTEARQRQFIRGAFQHYLDAEVVERLAESPEQLRLGGERRELTILFTDIRGFSTISEKMEPEALGELLTEHLGAQTEIVLRHGGLLDKYIGDAVMAFWGAPAEVADHAQRACLAALDIVAAMPNLRLRWHARGWPDVYIGVGVATGDAIVGNFGSAARFNYTVISDAVNLASRLEGLNKIYKTRILVSETTREHIGPDFICREIDCVRPKGKTEPVTIFELLCHRRNDGSGRAAQLAGAFTQAFMAYRARRFRDAIAAVEAVRALEPDGEVIVRFAERCRSLIADPPPAGWDGVYDATTK